VLDKDVLPVNLDVARLTLHVLAATIWVGVRSCFSRWWDHCARELQRRSPPRRACLRGWPGRLTGCSSWRACGCSP